jgi:hypothetical protein
MAKAGRKESMSTVAVKSPSKTKIRCVISGLVLSVRPDVYAQRIAKFGSEEKLQAGYVSNASKKMLRGGMTVTEIRTKAGTVNVKSLPTVDSLKDVIARVTTKKVSKAPKAPKAAKVVEAPAVDADVAAFLGAAPKAVAKKK